MTFELKIPDISKLENFCSPEVIIQEIPWRILVGRELHGSKQWLAIYLHCMSKDSSQNWSYTAVSSFKLKSFGENQKSVQRHVQPFLFDQTELGFGTGSFIEWNDLFNPKKSFVKDDMIKVDITIEVEDPSDNKKSELVFENVHNNCNHSKFRLNITNPQNLMAVRSPVFALQKQPWFLTVCKDHSSNLVVRLHSNSEVSCKKRMLVRLVSLHKRSVQQIKSENVSPGGILSTSKFISWDELLKVKNGFFKDNLVSIEVEITSKEFSSNCTSTEIRAINSVIAEEPALRLKCAICLERIENQEVSSILCGHLFCSKCIKYSIKKCKLCPMCKTQVTLNHLRRVYLPL